MAAGLLWSRPDPGRLGAVAGGARQPVDLIPPVDALVDVLPAALLFGLGISCVVAPLTSTLMGSIPARYSGLGSAINNSISRVGQPLLGAIIFIAISAAFYNVLGSMVPGLDTSDPAVRAAFQPLNPLPPGTPDQVAAAAKEASIDAFHLAALVSAGLMAAGSAVVRHRPAVRLGEPEAEAEADCQARPSRRSGRAEGPGDGRGGPYSGLSPPPRRIVSARCPGRAFGEVRAPDLAVAGSRLAATG